MFKDDLRLSEILLCSYLPEDQEPPVTDDVAERLVLDDLVCHRFPSWPEAPEWAGARCSGGRRHPADETPEALDHGAGIAWGTRGLGRCSTGRAAGSAAGWGCGAFVVEFDGERGRGEHGGVGADGDADQQGEGEVGKRVAAEEEQCG